MFSQIMLQFKMSTITNRNCLIDSFLVSFALFKAII